jgi:hypothetical protein
MKIFEFPLSLDGISGKECYEQFQKGSSLALVKANYSPVS